MARSQKSFQLNCIHFFTFMTIHCTFFYNSQHKTATVYSFPQGIHKPSLQGNKSNLQYIIQNITKWNKCTQIEYSTKSLEIYQIQKIQILANILHLITVQCLTVKYIQNCTITVCKQTYITKNVKNEIIDPKQLGDCCIYILLICSMYGVFLCSVVEAPYLNTIRGSLDENDKNKCWQKK